MKKHYNLERIICLYMLLISTNATFSQCFVKTSAGYSNGVGIKADNSIWGWGFGNWGQLNNGTYLDEYSPILLSNQNVWQSVKNSFLNTFAIKTDGTLWACGYNLSGELGIGSSIDHSPTFVQVGTSNNWKDVVSSISQTIAMKTDNTLWGWGQNDNYQVGNNTCCSNILSPVLVSSATDWKMIAVSNVRSSFALKTNGTLWGWGANSSGLLGESTTTVIQTPTQINPDTDWKTISVGEFHILAIKNNNTLWAWGGWGNGETGHNPANAHDPSTPNQIPGTNWSKIAAGYRFSLGIKTDGTLWAWGKNDVGQLGEGTTTDKYLPVQIGTDTNWESVSAGYQHVVALKTNGAVVTWGNNDFGQLGNGTTTSSITPAAITITGCVLDNTVFDRENDGVVLAPNPTTGKVFLDGVGLYQSVGVYNCLGQEVLSLDCARDDKTVTLDLSDYPSGVYLVKIANGDGVLEKRVLKQ